MAHNEKHRRRYGVNVLRAVATAGWVELVGANPHRCTLLISPSDACNIRVDLNGTTPVGEGIEIPQNGHELELTYDNYGDALCRPVRIFGSVAATVLNAWEVVDLDCGCPKH